MRFRFPSVRQRGTSTLVALVALLLFAAVSIFVLIDAEAAPVSTAPGPGRSIERTAPVTARTAPTGRRSVAPTTASPTADDEDVENPVLLGRVELPSGDPAIGARVWLGRRGAHVDRHGGFRIPLDEVEPDAALIAILEDHQPTTLVGPLEEAARVAPEPLTLVVQPARTIEGRLVDHRGEPCPRWRVELFRGTAMPERSFPEMFAEDVAAGGYYNPGRSSGNSPNRQRTGEDGRFVMRGLRDGASYVLRAWNESTLERVVSSPVLAGTPSFEWVVPPPELRERVFGTVTDNNGGPLKDVRVRLTMRVHQRDGQATYQTGQQVTTSADGRYEFENVPRVELLIRYTAPDVESVYVDLPADAEGPVDVRLAVLCRFRLETSTDADALVVLDANGERLEMVEELRPGVTRSTGRAPISDRKSNTLTIADTAAMIVLQRDGEELERFPIRLVPGALQVAPGK